MNNTENKKIGKIEKRLGKIEVQVNNHIPTKIGEVDKKIDQVIDNHEKMWPIICKSNEVAAKALNGLKNLTERLMRKKIIP